MSKKCFKCEIEKPVDEFYRHPAMADGRLGKCKECTRMDTRTNRSEKVEYYREYDRGRGNRLASDYEKNRYHENQGKYRAKRIVGRAVKKGHLVPMPCEACGALKAHAHHDDYSKPLNVRWLCPAHHRQWHVQHGEAPNGGPVEK